MITIATTAILRSHFTQESCAIAKMTARCALYKYSVSQKKIPPLRFSDNFFQTDWNFLINFYTPITRSFLH